MPMQLEGLPSPNWYPGHMRTAERELGEKLRLLDVIVEVADARAPGSSRNDRFQDFLKSRGHVLVLAKADLAEPAALAAWTERYRGQHLACLPLDLRQPGAGEGLGRVLAEAARRRRSNAAGHRVLVRPNRVAVVGVPNVGKSTLINLLVQRRRARTGPLPGVTRQQQWVPLGEELELLDTPGVLLPRLPDRETGLKLGLVAALKDDVVGPELLVEYLLHVCRRDALAGRLRRYGLEELPASAAELLAAVARASGSLGPGGGIDARRAATAVLQDFRAGRLGLFALDGCPPAG